MTVFPDTPHRDFDAEASTLEGRIARLRSDQAEASARLVELDNERRSIAVAAAEGEPKAAKRAEAIAVEEAALSGKARTLRHAEDALALQLRDVRDAKRIAEEQMRNTEAVEVARRLVQISADIDSALERVRDLAERRHHLARALNSLGVSTRRMLTPGALIPAAGNAGLRDQLGLDGIARMHWQPLAVSDQTILSNLLGPPSVQAAITVGQSEPPKPQGWMAVHLGFARWQVVTRDRRELLREPVHAEIAETIVQNGRIPPHLALDPTADDDDIDRDAAA